MGAGGRSVPSPAITSGPSMPPSVAVQPPGGRLGLQKLDTGQSSQTLGDSRGQRPTIPLPSAHSLGPFTHLSAGNGRVPGPGPGPRTDAWSLPSAVPHPRLARPAVFESPGRHSASCPGPEPLPGPSRGGRDLRSPVPGQSAESGSRARSGQAAEVP